MDNPECPQRIITRADLLSLPCYIDGGDGSLWQSRCSLDEAASDEHARVSHYIRLSDLLALFEAGESPESAPVEIPPCVTPPYALS